MNLPDFGDPDFDMESFVLQRAEQKTLEIIEVEEGRPLTAEEREQVRLGFWDYVNEARSRNAK